MGTPMASQKIYNFLCSRQNSNTALLRGLEPEINSAPARTRIWNLLLRKQALCPIELRGQLSGLNIPRRAGIVKVDL